MGWSSRLWKTVAGRSSGPDYPRYLVEAPQGHLNELAAWPAEIVGAAAETGSGGGGGAADCGLVVAAPGCVQLIVDPCAAPA